MEGVEFHQGTPADQDFGARRFDLITMWHFLEHDYTPYIAGQLLLAPVLLFERRLNLAMQAVVCERGA